MPAASATHAARVRQISFMTALRNNQGPLQTGAPHRAGCKLPANSSTRSKNTQGSADT